MNIVLAGIIAWILIQLLIGVVVSRRVTTEADYLVAGRRLGFGIATFSIFATWFGAETCIGSAGAVYEGGLSRGSSDPFGYAVCLVLMGFVFAVPLWRRKLTTLADLFRERFSVNVERLAVIMMVPTSILWAAAQVRAFGQVLATASGLEVSVTIAIATGVVILYTAFGGLMADAVTDFVQGISLAVGLVIILVAVLYELGGAGPAVVAIDPGRLRLFGEAGRPLLDGIESWAVPICGSVVAQELVARVIATRSPGIARRACLTGAGIYLALGLIPVFIGLVGARLIPGLADPETILPMVARHLLPDVLYAVFAGALLSAILSTVDSCVLSAAALTSHNLVVRLFPVMPDARKVKVARWGVVIFGLVAYVLATRAESVLALVENASAFGSAGIFVIVLMGLFTRLGGSRAAMTSLVSGMTVWVIGNYLHGWPHPYLASLVAATVGYLAVAFAEPRAGENLLAAPAIVPMPERVPGDIDS